MKILWRVVGGIIGVADLLTFALLVFRWPWSSYEWRVFIAMLVGIIGSIDLLITGRFPPYGFLWHRGVVGRNREA